MDKQRRHTDYRWPKAHQNLRHTLAPTTTHTTSQTTNQPNNNNKRPKPNHKSHTQTLPLKQNNPNTAKSNTPEITKTTKPKQQTSNQHRLQAFRQTPQKHKTASNQTTTNQPTARPTTHTQTQNQTKHTGIRNHARACPATHTQHHNVRAAQVLRANTFSSALFQTFKTQLTTCFVHNQPSVCSALQSYLQRTLLDNATLPTTTTAKPTSSASGSQNYAGQSAAHSNKHGAPTNNSAKPQTPNRHRPDGTTAP